MNKNAFRLTLALGALVLVNCNLLSPALSTPPQPNNTPAGQALASPTGNARALPVATGAASPTAARPATAAASAVPSSTTASTATPATTAAPTPQRSRLISAENAKDVVEVGRWGTGALYNAAYSPDGKLLVVPSANGLHLYDSQTLSESLFIETAGELRYAAFSPDGKTLAAANTDSMGRWDAASGRPLGSRYGYSSTVTNPYQVIWQPLAISPDGSLLAAASDSHTVQLWDLATGRALRTWSLKGESLVESLAFAPDGKTLAFGDAVAGTVTVWDVASGKALHSLGGLSIYSSGDYVTSLAFSPDGSKLAVAAHDQTLTLWDLAAGKLLGTWNVGEAFAMAFAPDGQTLAFGGGANDQTLKVWDVASGSQRYVLSHVLSGHIDYLHSVVFSPDGKTLASSSNESTKLWDPATGQLLNTLPADDVTAAVTFAPDSQTLAYGLRDGTVKVRDTASGATRSLSGHPYAVESVAFSPDGHTLASGSSDVSAAPGSNVLKLWDVASGHELRTLSGHAGFVFAVAFSPDGQTLASGSFDESAILWNAASGQALHTLTGHRFVYSVAFSPDGQTLAAGSEDKTITLWNVASGSAARTQIPASRAYWFFTILRIPRQARHRPRHKPFSVRSQPAAAAYTAR